MGVSLGLAIEKATVEIGSTGLAKKKPASLPLIVSLSYHLPPVLFLMLIENTIVPVSSVGRASDYRAGGLGFKPQTGPTLRVLK